MNERIKSAQAVFNCLNKNKFTLTSFLALAISSNLFSEDICAVETTIQSTVPLREGEVLRQWIHISSICIYETEMHKLLKKETSLHMNVNVMWMEQFELARVPSL